MFQTACKLVSISFLLAGVAEAQYTSTDLAAHSTSSDCWSVIDGGVYDLTAYASSHPGGTGVIYAICGVDGTSSYNSKHSGKNYPTIFATYKGTFSTGGGSTDSPTSAPVDGVYTADDLAAHSTPSNCWTVVDGDVYDVTGYAAKHAGGSARINNMCGVDASSEYNSQHQGTNYISTFTTYKGTFSTSGGSAPTNPPVTDDDSNSDDGGDGAGGFGGLCFSAVSTAQVEGKGPVAMKELKVGDKVLTGNQKYETVYGFGHLHATKVARFLQIYTENNKVPLEMTEEHMVFVAGKKNPVRAGSIRVGDVLQSGFSGSQVKKISSIKREGLYAPLTPDGTIIVDGIKASSYIALQDRAVEYLELQYGFQPMSQHNAVHLFLAPFRLICRATSADFCQEYNENGMPHYVASGLAFAQWIDALDMNILLQVSLCSIFLVVFASFMAMEVAADALYTYGTPMVFLALAAFLAFKTVGINVSAKKIKKVA